MDDFQVNLFEEGGVDEYRTALNDYYSDLISDRESSLTITKSNLELYVKSLLNKLKDAQVLFHYDRPFEPGDRFRSDDYNNAMREIYIDLKVIYNKILTMETTADNIIDVIQFVRNNILNNIEKRNAEISVLKNLIDRNIIYDDIHIIDNRENDYPDSDLAANTNNNTITLNEIDEERLDITTLHNDVSLIDFNPNMDINSKVYNIDKTKLIHIYGKSQTPHNSYDKRLSRKFSVSSNKLSSGMNIGIVIDLSKPTMLNTINLALTSPYPIEIEGVYYTHDNITNIYNQPINEVNYKINTFNIDDINIVLDNTITARNVILLVKQPTMEIKPEPDHFIDYQKYIDHINNISNNYSSVDVNIKNNSLHRRLRRTIESIIDYINKILNKESTKTDTHIYEIMINGIDIIHNYYNDASTFLSPAYKSDKKIHSVSLYDTTLDNYDTNTDTVVNHYIKVGKDNELSVMPLNDDTYTHVIVINDTDDNTYKTPFPIDMSKPVSVTRNSQAYSNYSEIKISDSIATGIQLDGTYSLNDIFTVTFTPSSTNILGQTIDPKTINIDQKFKPNLKNKTCIHNRYVNKILLKHTDDTYVAYTIGTECYESKIPFDDDNYSGYVIINPKKMTNMPDYVILSATTIGVKEDSIIPPMRTVYFGILDEVKSADYTSDIVLHTDKEYVPSSLFIYSKDDMTLVNYDEYTTDVSGQPLIDKTSFTLHASSDYPVNGTLLLQYAPAGFVSGEINISDYNILEEYQNTDQNGALQISNTPFIDNAIIASLTETPPAWLEGDGIWFLRFNNDVVYKPIDITVDGSPAIDKTQYTTLYKPELTEFDDNIGNYEFVIMAGGWIKFNTPIENKPIAISYYTNNDELRLKTKLYRLNRNTDDKTAFMQHTALLINEE